MHLSFLNQTGLKGAVEVTAENGTLVIWCSRKAREGWAEPFAEMA
jgi:hypothetical protein